MFGIFPKCVCALWLSSPRKHIQHMYTMRNKKRTIYMSKNINEIAIKSTTI